MKKISTIWSKRLSLRQLVVAALVLGSSSLAQDQLVNKATRKPANYVPNDDIIVVPVEAEMSFYEKHFLNDPKFSQNSNVQRQIRIWQENEIKAQQHGHDTQAAGSFYYVPTQEEKFRLVERSYFRFLLRKGQEPIQDEGQEMLNSWTASDEIDSIDEMEATFRATTRKTATGKDLPQAFREKQVAKTKKFRFHIQPRVEQGLLIMRITGPVDARAWVGVNGEAEMNIQKTFDQTGTRVQANYFVHDGRYLAAIDQNLGIPGLRARVTTTRKGSQRKRETIYTEDSRFQFIFGREF